MNTYKLKITTLSPIHIGTGEDYEPTNFVINNGRFYNFDEVLFYKSLNSLEQNSFNQKLDNWLMIIDFYKSKAKEATKIARFDCKATKAVEERYNKKLKNKDGTRNSNQFQIAQTFKNPNNFRAIIPGSSIKGMLDTVLKIYPPKESNEVRQKLIISDALMVDGELEIGYSYRKHKNTSKNNEGKIPQMVEIIKPNSTFICQIKSEYSFDKMKSMMKSYHDDRKDSIYKETDNSFIARVGKYCGKEYMVDDGKNVLNSYQKPIATHTVYEENNEPFGWIKIELIEDSEYRNLVEKIRHQENAYFHNLEEKQKEIIDQLNEAKFKAEQERIAKEQKKLQEQKEAEEKEKLEKKRLSLLSPLELKLDELSIQNKSMPQTTLILQNIKNGKLDEFRDEALKLLEKLMKENKEWKEKPTGKKPEKDKEYQKTLEVKKLMGLK
ncbi:MAG: hypothetical protein KN64_00955 [Sulfurovum sp. AS07-7]|nr:MAG: hypothetical protein KN64_00955 [Sulfurovum sp. AS07-7]